MKATAEFWRDPNLPYVESRRACHSRASYKPHSHPTYSIGAVDQGTSLFTGAVDGPAVIKAGTVVFIPGSCVHACNPLPDTAWNYQMLHLDTEWLETLRQESSITGHPSSVMLCHEPSVYQAFCRLNALLFDARSSHEKEAALIEFVGDHDTQGQTLIPMPANPALASRGVQDVMDFLQHDSPSMQPLAKLAAIAGLSRYQLIRAFRLATGMTPHAWQLNHSINQARLWLQAGEGMAAIAYRLGFADQAHFQRMFKAHVGITPGAYKR